MFDVLVPHPASSVPLTHTLPHCTRTTHPHTHLHTSSHISTHPHSPPYDKCGLIKPISGGGDGQGGVYPAKSDTANPRPGKLNAGVNFYNFYKGQSHMEYVNRFMCLESCYIPFIHLYCRICTYVHPLYMYIHHTPPSKHPLTPSIHPKYTPSVHGIGTNKKTQSSSSLFRTKIMTCGLLQTSSPDLQRTGLVRQSKGTTSEVRKRLSCLRTTPKPARARPTLTKITSANRCTTLPRVNRPPPLPLWPPEPPPAQASRRSVRARRSLAFWGHVTASLGAPARIALGASED